jgi:general stress protein CsbA
MDWVQILSALFLGAMLVFLFPRMKHAVKESPKGSAQDWMGVIVPLLLVVGFVLLLMSMV